MHTTSKRFIFGILSLLFFIYTIFIYTKGVTTNKGNLLLNEQCKQGKILFQKYNCTSCHQLYGLGGYMGPDLTNVISAAGMGPDYVKTILRNGTQRMPDFHIPEKEIEQLVAFLSYVDKTGISPAKKFNINSNGTVDYECK